MRKIKIVIITLILIIVSYFIYENVIDYQAKCYSEFDNQNYKIALSYCIKGSNQDPESALKASMILLQGLGNTEIDIEQGEYYLQVAGRKGNVDAMAELGERYFYGKDFIQRDNLAFYWSYRAAQQGNKKAAKIVSQMFREGREVEKDKELSDFWDKESKK